MLVPADSLGQRRYVRTAARVHPVPSLGIGPTILRGLRDLGYRDTPAAIAALIDNAIDAKASQVDIVLDGDGSEVRGIAVIDNGFGMVPEMMRAACAVGATCPLGDGPHLARSGFGLPSAPFAIGRRFHLLSGPTGTAIHALTVDIDDLADEDVQIPEAQRSGLPGFVSAYLARQHLGWSAGTIVVLDALDRLSSRSPRILAEQLHAQLGFVFGQFTSQLTLRIDGQLVAPVDPLFLTAITAGDALEDRALAEDKGTLAVEIDGGRVTLRTALLPTLPLSLRRRGAGPQGAQVQQTLLRDTNGMVVSRLGRRLTVLPTTPLFHFAPADRTIRAEIDFTADLDDLFAPALNLQQVQVSDRIWEALRANGAAHHLQSLRREVGQSRKRQWQDAPVAVLRPASPRRHNCCQK